MPDRLATLLTSAETRRREGDRKLRRETFQKWAEPIIATAILLLIPFLIAITGLVLDNRTQIDENQTFSQASREGRILFQAKQNFLLCSRGPDVMLPERREEVRAACVGYETLEASIATERALQDRLQREANN